MERIKKKKFRDGHVATPTHATIVHTPPDTHIHAHAHTHPHINTHTSTRTHRHNNKGIYEFRKYFNKLQFAICIFRIENARI